MVEEEGWEQPSGYGELLQEYEAARGGAVLFDNSSAGIMFLNGPDGADLLNRISTNDVVGLAPGQGTATVLTTPTARIIARLLIYMEPEQLLVLTAAANREKVLSHLRRNIFFMDQVTVTDASDELGLMTVFGSRADDLLSQVAESEVGSLNHHHHIATKIAGVDVRIARAEAVIGDGFNILCSHEALTDLWTKMIEIGARPIGLEAYEILRVEAGVPAAGHELGGDTTPLDTALLDDISFSKGCYTGQEVIARMVNYDKMPRGLFGLRLASATTLPPPAPVEVGGKQAGQMTSIAQSPHHGTIGLAILRRAQAPAGTQVQVVTEGGRIAAEVVTLPFRREV